MIWFYAAIPFLFWSILALTALIYGPAWGPGVATILIAWAVLGAWSLLEMRPQAAFIHDHLGGVYAQKSLSRPAGIWTASVGGLVILGLCILHPFVKEIQTNVAQIEDSNQSSLERQDRIFAEQMRRIEGFEYDKNLTKLTFNGNVLFYEAPVSATEANRLGRFLVAYGHFKANGSKEAKVTKSGATYEYHLKVKPGFENDQDFIQACRAFSDQLSENVFDNAPVDVHLCDDTCETVHVVSSHH